jgi:hypothetical protein
MTLSQHGVQAPLSPMLLLLLLAWCCACTAAVLLPAELQECGLWGGQHIRGLAGCIQQLLLLVCQILQVLSRLVQVLLLFGWHLRYGADQMLPLLLQVCLCQCQLLGHLEQ